ncbi:hypothetical protein FOCG_06794 [Fusarium oxysporum f. sp. radicis-lycopersici 26381]|uniref:Uncharacterized protein n=3 Tax=Fusarium oxysporum TaxID=5507 RepID=W9J4D0_FUSOX|nr:hypothetical protein FOYG_01520 [Fusarium oxysporum NRRL 32931]EWZ48180.1 hypothetical protein FOZG_03852 [Fusarium oxysporum Fo47]EWZ93253.1 hypothetical protein FOWG_06091 [Fusarium oxysporum f. sp. lycopersici MN25]EXK45512.1 hypothetical protein FOMG_03929 [Fusarium oxysporum f. sp. melonis 26406]EXL53514.1 hypothetical protein FOCG_06794 [Fusarium oxysporum f. sp. radicis-lycopersici 26381]
MRTTNQGTIVKPPRRQARLLITPAVEPTTTINVRKE